MSDNLKKIPIENNKLTPNMKLSRSGSTMMFRKDYGDRKITRIDNADVVIKAPKPELVAELIDGEWYWFNDCDECNGNGKDWGYVKCEKHNVCVTCGTPRKDIKGTAWGHRKGFRCDPCQTALNEQARRKALEKVAEKEYDEWDHQYTDDLLCPHCGTKQHHEMSDGEPSSENECEICGGKFSVEIDYSWTYSTRVIGERETL